MNSTRAAAMQCLLRVDKGEHAQKALAQSGLTGKDRQFCSDLVYGSLRARLRCRQIIKTVLPQPQRLPPLMRIALEMAVYSLHFQEKAAPYAIVSETVKLIKARFGQRLANVANAALRKLAQIELPGQPQNFAQLAEFYSLPPEIAQLWRMAYGEAAAIALMRRSFQRPHACLRVNMLKPQAQNLLAALLQCPGAAEIAPAGVAFAAGALPERLAGKDLQAWQAQGNLSFQSAGSQLALHALGLHDVWRDRPIWDICAGFGNKSAALLELGLNVSLASDIYPPRLLNITAECNRLDLPAPAIVAADAARPPVKYWHGHILADVPCSGLGVLSRRPDIKGKFTLAATMQLQEIQAAILQRTADRLAPGGELAYITCSLDPAENDGQISALLRKRSDLKIACQWQTPHDHPWLEGMYACRLRKLA